MDKKSERKIEIKNEEARERNIDQKIKDSRKNKGMCSNCVKLLCCQCDFQSDEVSEENISIDEYEAEPSEVPGKVYSEEQEKDTTDFSPCLSPVKKIKSSLSKMDKNNAKKINKQNLLKKVSSENYSNQYNSEDIDTEQFINKLGKNYSNDINCKDIKKASAINKDTENRAFLSSSVGSEY